MGRRRARRFLIRVGGGLALAAGLVTAAYFLSSRVHEIGHGFVHGYRSDLAWLREGDSERIVIPSTPRLVADLYRPASPASSLVILAHGSTWRGRKEAAVRLLASRLRREGLAVLAVDLAGFGESEDPPLPLSEDFSFGDSIAAAARHARERGFDGSDVLIYAGISLGAKSAIQAGRLDPRPRAVVAIGGGHTRVWFEEEGPEWRRWFARGRFVVMRLEPDEGSVETMARLMERMDVVEQLRQPGLPPVLLVYGEHERAYPTIRAAVVAERLPCRLKMIPGAPHDLHIRGVGSSPLVTYNETILTNVVEESTAWIAAAR